MASIPAWQQVSLNWRDIGSTAFTKTKGNDSPNRQKDDLVLGMTFDGSVPLLGVAGGLEYRHITDNDEQIGKKIHLGAEVTLAMFDFRAGLYQGYYTYGFGMNLWLLQFDAALYSVERGIYPGQTEDRRFQASILIDLEFDPNFKLVSSDGKARKLKQRR